MRIRRRPGFLLSPPPPMQSPDLLTETHELKSNHSWCSEPADQQDLNKKASESRLLHSVEDLQLEASKAFPFFNPDQSDQNSLFSFLDSKRDLKESHSQNPSVNTTKSSGAPPSPANKRKKPAILMEGSRCSRVNGRGWRCSQPTLVGYSLCEHHLGKGRLRSMSSVKEAKLENSSPDIVSTTKSKKKIGVVKARSLSSLLGDNIAGDMPLSTQLRRSTEREEC
ncbi:uncharacterized protein LOC110096605 [Dendrobium catenatum]|uniref:Growth-regulating factor 9 n=1 Tax=Dendrobium catenatum TaxID=906689 RepID=A0A2I0WQE9_9ASPA|nr:uncharacterized protein LOC110096605 [Dendrobium catenatum]PKU77902.1 Growth-regulating factor 9 [Dendrobium catenatum]